MRSIWMIAAIGLLFACSATPQQPQHTVDYRQALLTLLESAQNTPGNDSLLSVLRAELDGVRLQVDAAVSRPGDLAWAKQRAAALLHCIDPKLVAAGHCLGYGLIPVLEAISVQLDHLQADLLVEQENRRLQQAKQALWDMRVRVERLKELALAQLKEISAPESAIANRQLQSLVEALDAGPEGYPALSQALEGLRATQADRGH